MNEQSNNPDETTTTEQPPSQMSHKNPNGLGLILAVVASGLVSGRGNTAIVAFVAYLIGASVGYGIEVIKISRKGKNALVGTVGVLLFLAIIGIQSYFKVQGMVDPYGMKEAFPSLSDQALCAFNNTMAQQADPNVNLGAIIYNLLVKGEALLTQAERDEMVHIHWKAVRTLSQDDQNFVTMGSMKVNAGGGYSATDQSGYPLLFNKDSAICPRKIMIVTWD
ncbi:MAG: MgtC/SapB family protein [Candidatus Aureabacteria bacterium]|nr:MgtC/SapB family protein [Candidatus Auribacterota bacterium]